MRDIVWTVIVVWVVWKIYDVFKHASKSKNSNFNKGQDNYYRSNEGEVRIDKQNNHKSHFNPNDGEYVDYEEIK